MKDFEAQRLLKNKDWSDKAFNKLSLFLVLLVILTIVGLLGYGLFK